MESNISDGIWLQRMRMIAKLVLRFAAVCAAGVGVYWIIQWVLYVLNSGPSAVVFGGGPSYHLNYFFTIISDFTIAGLIVIFEPTLTKWLVPNPGALCPACGYPYQPDNPPPQCTECGIALASRATSDEPHA